MGHHKGLQDVIDMFPSAVIEKLEKVLGKEVVLGVLDDRLEFERIEPVLGAPKAPPVILDRDDQDMSSSLDAITRDFLRTLEVISGYHCHAAGVTVDKDGTISIVHSEDFLERRPYFIARYTIKDGKRIVHPDQGPSSMDVQVFTRLPETLSTIKDLQIRFNEQEAGSLLEMTYNINGESKTIKLGRNKDARYGVYLPKNLDVDIGMCNHIRFETRSFAERFSELARVGFTSHISSYGGVLEFVNEEFLLMGSPHVTIVGEHVSGNGSASFSTHLNESKIKFPYHYLKKFEMVDAYVSSNYVKLEGMDENRKFECWFFQV
jgi:hypothetical protein